MKASTVDYHASLLRERLESVFHFTRLSCYSNKQFLKNLKEYVYDTPSWSKVPERIRSEIRGIERSYVGELYKYYLLWAWKVNGKVKEFNEMTDEERNMVFDQKVKGHHYWLKEGSRTIENGQVTRTYSITDKYF